MRTPGSRRQEPCPPLSHFTCTVQLAIRHALSGGKSSVSDLRYLNLDFFIEVFKC